MSYAIGPDEGVSAAVRRVVLEQIDAALGEIGDAALDRHEAVHQVRKRCKKVRAVLRLARKGLGARYAEDNARFRDAARTLSPLRDADVLVGTLEVLLEGAGPDVDRAAADVVMGALRARCEAAAGGPPTIDERLEAFAGTLLASRPALARLAVEGGRRTLARGFRKTYRRGRKEMRRSLDEPSDAQLHAWRKRVKYHGYHLRLVREVAGPARDSHAEAVDELGDLLGLDHDLATLRARLEGDTELGEVAVGSGLVRRLAARREELQTHAFALGREVFARKPKVLLADLELDRD